MSRIWGSWASLNPSLTLIMCKQWCRQIYKYSLTRERRPSWNLNQWKRTSFLAFMKLVMVILIWIVTLDYFAYTRRTDLDPNINTWIQRLVPARIYRSNLVHFGRLFMYCYKSSEGTIETAVNCAYTWDCQH